MVDSLVGNDYSTCLCDGLSAMDVEVHLIVPQNRYFSQKNNFEVVFLSPSKERGLGKLIKIWGFIKYIILLRRYIKVIKCDLVHYQFFRRKIGILFFKYLNLRGVKLIVTAHNVLPHEKSKIDYFLNSIIYKNANAIIAHSKLIRDKLVKNFTIDPGKIHIIPHGNFDIYLPDKKLTIADARLRLSLTLHDNVMLYFGFIRPYKGIDLLLKAFEKSAEKDSKLKLIIAGSAHNIGLQNSIESAIDNSRFKDRIIHHLKYIPNEDIAKYFIAADLLVLPYKNIDHSGIIHLAYSFGKAVLATNVGDFNEVIVNEKSGKILKGQSYTELSEAITEMFKDKNKLFKMGNYAKILSETKYSWNDIAKQTIQLYKEVSLKK